MKCACGHDLEGQNHKVTKIRSDDLKDICAYKLNDKEFKDFKSRWKKKYKKPYDEKRRPICGCDKAKHKGGAKLWIIN